MNYSSGRHELFYSICQPAIPKVSEYKKSNNSLNRRKLFDEISSLEVNSKLYKKTNKVSEDLLNLNNYNQTHSKNSSMIKLPPLSNNPESIGSFSSF